MNHLSSFFPDPKGARLHYQYWEDSSKGYDRVGLVLHGLGYHSGSYPELVPAFVSARYKVIAPDFAGFGASPGRARRGRGPRDGGRDRDALPPHRVGRRGAGK